MKLETPQNEEDYTVYIKQLNSKQQKEHEYFVNSPTESSQAPIYKSVIEKTQSIQFFNDIMNKYNLSFNKSILELGGGYGYLSCFIKMKQPDIQVTFTDVSEEAVKKSKQYEEFFNIKLDKKVVTSAEQTPFEDNSFENILFFASFHHVQEPQKALNECYRILNPGGNIYLFMEPSCPPYLSALFRKYVNRDEVEENFYTASQYKTFAQKAGFNVKSYNYKNFLYRWRLKATIYYMALNFIPGFLTNLFPCTQVLIGKKSIL